MARKSSFVLSPVRTVLAIAAIAITIHLALLLLVGGGVPGAYEIGQLVGTHIAAAIVTALIASFTNVGSAGALIAVYLLAFLASQALLALTAIG